MKKKCLNRLQKAQALHKGKTVTIRKYDVSGEKPRDVLFIFNVNKNHKRKVLNEKQKIN